MSWNDGNNLINNLQIQRGGMRTIRSDDSGLRDDVRSHQKTIESQQKMLNQCFEHIRELSLRLTETVRLVDKLEEQISRKFDEVDDNIEKLWYAPGGPAAAQLIVQYDHKNIIND